MLLIRWTDSRPVIVTIRDNGKFLRVLFYSPIIHYRMGVLLTLSPKP